jgi:hypothetical protein
MRVRAYVSDRYSAEVSDQEQKITGIIANANEVLGPTLDLQLDLAELRRWPITRDDDLDSLVNELATVDAGDDVGWVVGFVGKSATLEVSFHQLGMARMPGKHFVLRAMNDAVEYDFIQKNFGELDDRERSEIYNKRLEHKETSVFLHELAHTLGVPHTRKRRTVMHAIYDHKADRFSLAAAQLMAKRPAAFSNDAHWQALSAEDRALVRQALERSSWIS